MVTAAADARLRGFELRSGRLPQGNSEVLLDEGTMLAQGWQLGERLTLSKNKTKLSATLVGTAPRPSGRDVGEREGVAMAARPGVLAIAGESECTEFRFRLRDSGRADDFQDALATTLPGTYAVTFDNGMRFAF